jgi:arginase
MRHSHIAVIGAPLDLGAGRRGVDMGPSAIRFANLGQRLSALGYQVQDLGNVAVQQPERIRPGSRSARYLSQIAKSCTRLAAMVKRVAEKGQVPLVLGGDHSVAVGTVSGMSKHLREAGQKLGLLWIDAHPDMNTPQTSPSGNVHGMPLACLIGLGPRQLTHIYDYAPKVDPENVALVGLRDVDLLEKPYVKTSGVRTFTMRDIDERLLHAVMKEALEIVSEGTEGFHVSLDMDAVDPEHAPGVGTAVRGGLSYREAHLAMEMICDSQRMTSMDVVEVNPVIDEANRTAILAVELVLSALGKRIL